jgi:hypothetical protein
VTGKQSASWAAGLALLWALDALAQWLVVTPAFSNDVTGLLLWSVSFLAMMLTFVSFVVGLAALLQRGASMRQRSPGGVLVVLAIVVTILGTRLDNHIRMQGFRACASRLQPVVDAIEAYDLKNGHPPADLASLFPTEPPSAYSGPS